MRIISLNLNGIRSAASKGFYPWLSRQRADIVCLQETRAQTHQLEDPCYRPRRFHSYYHDAEKKGYSGTALYTRIKPREVRHGIGIDWIDREGRYLEAEFSNLTVISLYLPSGSSGEERQGFKYRMMDVMRPHMIELRKTRPHPIVICGDWNIAHTEADIRNWKGNLKNSGFLPEERQWLGELFDQCGYRDSFRLLDQKEHEYSWWSNRGRAWDNNVGWRIDYQIISEDLAPVLQKTRIYRGKRFSDHAPLIHDYDYRIAP